jgi:hypothetical protein
MAVVANLAECERRGDFDFLDCQLYASDVWPKPSQLVVTMTYAEV